jgi:hypothetical protein
MRGWMAWQRSSFTELDRNLDESLKISAKNIEK